ncbi:MAG: glycosyltransferase family 2 protein [Candidatus Pacearchaeota archaeon]
MVIIGIAAYNEENNLCETLPYLEDQLMKMKIIKDSKILVCLNGCTDQTERIVKRMQREYNNIAILHSKKGKLKAHKKILDNLPNGEIIFFSDADVFVPRKTIQNILNEFKNNRNAKIISAYPYALKLGKSNLYVKLVYNVLNIKRIYPKIEVAEKDVSKFHGNVEDKFLKKSRIYFHGRFFGIKTKEVYQFPKKGSKIRGDDTFLTRCTLLKYGGGSIKVLFKSPVYCSPVTSVKEYLKSWYRIRKDIDLIGEEYPEYKEINKNVEMTINWDYLKKMKTSVKIYAVLFFILRKYEKYSFFILKRYIDLDNIWSYDKKDSIRRFK